MLSSFLANTFTIKDTKVCFEFGFDWAFAVIVSPIVNHM